jgi:hypothetical protein
MGIVKGLKDLNKALDKPTVQVAEMKQRSLGKD